MRERRALENPPLLIVCCLRRLHVILMPTRVQALRWALLKLTSQRYERAQLAIAHVKSTPDQRADKDWKQDREPGIAEAHVRGDGAAQITCQQNRAENSGAGNHVDDRTRGQKDSERDNHTFGKSIESRSRRAASPRCSRAWVPRCASYARGLSCPLTGQPCQGAPVVPRHRWRRFPVPPPRLR